MTDTSLPARPFWKARALAQQSHLHEQTVRYRHKVMVSLGDKLWPPMPEEWPLLQGDAQRLVDFNEPAIVARRAHFSKKL